MGVKTDAVPWMILNTILHTTVGSESHGVVVGDNDDHDEMAIFIEPPEYIIGLNAWDTYASRTAWERTGTSVTTPEQPRSIKGDTDFVAYGLKKYVSLIAKGNPSMIIPIFTPALNLIDVHPIFGHDLIKFGRKIVLNKKTAKAFLGYGCSQRHALEGKRSTRVKRPELVDEFGYDTKFAYHYLRLMIQGIELMETGSVSIPMSDDHRAQLLSVRKGAYPFEQIMVWGSGLEEKLEQLATSNDLPDQADSEIVNRFLREMYIDFWDIKGILINGTRTYRR